MKRLVFLRHTKTAFNSPPMRLRSILDVPLSDDGFSQIPSTVRKLKLTYPDVKAVYSSPLARASILATTVAHEFGLTATKIESMQSWNYGVLGGMYVDEILPALKALSTGAGREFAPKNGESMNDFLRRWTGALVDVIRDAPEEGCVVIVTHLQNIMMGDAWLKQGLPEIGKFEYEYKEANEISPGESLELKRVWI